MMALNKVMTARIRRIDDEGGGDSLMDKMDIDRKFLIQALNPVNGKRYTESDALLLCAKDAAVPAALNAYIDECVSIGANKEHVESAILLLARVLDFQIAAGGGRVPDTIGAEIPRCINGEGIEDARPEPMDFGAAIQALKRGRKVSRVGWNGKGMWLEQQTPDAHSKMTLPYIYLNYPADAQNTPGARVPWQPSQTDMLAEDWQFVE